jgi:hypothetical protein
MASAKEQMFAAEFQRRRQTYLKIVAPSLLLVAVASVLLAAELAVPRWVCSALFVVGFVGWSLSERISKYACPRCDSRPTPGEGWLAQPTKCQVCNLNFQL